MGLEIEPKAIIQDFITKSVSLTLLVTLTVERCSRKYKRRTT